MDIVIDILVVGRTAKLNENYSLTDRSISSPSTIHTWDVLWFPHYCSSDWSRSLSHCCDLRGLANCLLYYDCLLDLLDHLDHRPRPDHTLTPSVLTWHPLRTFAGKASDCCDCPCPHRPLLIHCCLSSPDSCAQLTLPLRWALRREI